MNQADQSKNTLATKRHFTQWYTYLKQTQTDFRELYRNCAQAIAPEIIGNVLDAGSGGVFYYDITRAKTIIAVDLARPEYLDRFQYPDKIKFVSGDARNLPFKDHQFDRIVMQFLIHHLAEKTLKETNQSVQLALTESSRLLAPNGKLLIVESFLPRPLEILENLIYPFSGRLFKLIKFPQVKQFSLTQLAKLIKKSGLEPVNIKQIPKGKYISQLGMRVPAALSPVRIYLIVARAKPV